MSANTATLVVAEEAATSHDRIQALEIDEPDRRLNNAGQWLRPEVSSLHSSAASRTITNSTASMTFTVVFTLTGINFMSNFCTGLLTIAIPRIAQDLNLQESLLLWPASVFSLTSGCSLLVAGAIADFIGNRNINLLGCFLFGVLGIGCGLAKTGIQLILFRAFQGVALAMCLPTAVSILTSTLKAGKARNLAFSFLGVAQPLGYAVGLVLGGVFAQSKTGWRLGFYIQAGITMGMFAINCWKLPPDRQRGSGSWQGIVHGIDWVGAGISSVCLGLLSYVFAVITGKLSSIHEPTNIVLLAVAGALIPAFIGWMSYQERKGRPALIPNSLWRKTAFSVICVMVFISWAVLTSIELFLSLFFQYVQGLSGIQASIRFIPEIIVAIALNFGTGLLVHRVRADHLVNTTSAISAISPLLMALINPSWSWWLCAFWAVVLSPLSADVIFTVANLIIVDVFPPHMQALAGAVFSTVSHFGNSFGLAIMAVISARVTANSKFAVKSSPEALMEGYRAVFWTSLALTVLSVVIGVAGLRRAGKVGLKKE